MRLRDLGIAWDRLRDLLVALVDRHLVVRSEQAGLHQELAAAVQVIRALEARVDSLEAGTAGKETPVPAGVAENAPDEAAPAEVRPSELNALLQELGEVDPELATAGSIEISFGCAWAEDLLEVALRRFGQRIASLAPEGYRAPNDVWIHVDLHEEWPAAALLRNARSRLADTGRLIVVTEARGPAPFIDGLVHLDTVASRAVSGARIGRWRHQRPRTA
jgi:hypothetical protein